MKRLLRVWGVVGLGLCLLLMVSGCETVQQYSITYKLWDNATFRKWNEPLPNPHLALFEPPGHTDLIVQYDAYSEKHSAIKRQAYYLQSNVARIRAGKAPRFLDAVATEGMKPIPVFGAKEVVSNPPTRLTNYAIISEPGREFTLHPQADPSEAVHLPVYCESSGTILRVSLTPLAVAGDAVMVGLVASVVALYGACASNLSASP